VSCEYSFFFSRRRRHTLFSRDWSSDVCSSDLQPEAGPVTLAAPLREEMTDQVPVTRIQRAWTGPEWTHADAVPLQVGMHVLGGLASSRLDTVLVREEQLAVRVSAYALQHEQLSMLVAEMDVKPGVETSVAEARFG